MVADIPQLVQGKTRMYCPEFCGVKWDGHGKRRARKVRERFVIHWMRRHRNGDS